MSGEESRSKPGGIVIDPFAAGLLPEDRQTVDPVRASQRPDTAEPAIAAGEMVGEYQIVEEIGRGGDGVVYAGVHPVIGKRVAIKLVRPDTAAWAEKFLREARALSRIDHPNVVDVYSYGELRDGQLYLVMQLLEGETLRQTIEDRRERGEPLSIAEGLSIARSLVSALEASHAEGIVHRDLKPENIMVRGKQSSEARVVLADFGIAKDTQDVDSTLTAEGIHLCTPAYAAPEQIRGREIRSAADVYALGTLLYEMWTGDLPYHGSTAADLMAQKLTETAPRMDGLRPELPAPVTALIARMLERDPAGRPTLAAASETLAAAAEEYAARAAVPSSNRWWLAPTAIAVAAVAGILLWIVAQGESEPENAARSSPSPPPSEPSEPPAPSPIGWVEVGVDVPDAWAFVDGRRFRIGPTPTSIPFYRPGRYQLQIAADDRPAITRVIDVGAGAHEELSVELADRTKSVEPVEPHTPPKPTGPARAGPVERHTGATTRAPPRPASRPRLSDDRMDPFKD